MPNAETLLQNKIRVAVNKSGHARLFRNLVGQFFTRFGGRVTAGLSVGSGDLIGFTINPGKISRFISFEVKTATGKPEDEQLAWMATINKYGGYACIVRSVEEALEHVTNANNY